MKTLNDLSTIEYENLIDFIREDLESNMTYSKLIETARKQFESQGRDFDKEFDDWKENHRR